MKLLNTVFAIVGALGLSASMMAQNEVDALRYGYVQAPTSVRAMGMGGAFGALGSDLTSAWSNPGGLGMYRRGAIEFGLGYAQNNAEATYKGTRAQNTRGRLTITSFGMFATKEKNQTGLVRLTYGISVNRINDFNQRISIRGNIENNSMLNLFAQQANGYTPEQLLNARPFDADLAWQTYLINPDDTINNTYAPDFTGGTIAQQKDIVRRGWMTETSFSLGMNFDEFIYVGAVIGIRGATFEETANYQERFADDQNVSRFSYFERNYVSGIGLNLKLGLVVKATEWLRVGAAYHTPTAMSLTDSYSTTMNSYFRNGTLFEALSPDNLYEYRVKTPGRILANAAFVLGEMGVIAADYEYANYSNMRMTETGFTDNPYDFASENEVIQRIYKGTHSVRVGAEFRILNDWRARAGASLQQTPFVNGTSNTTDRLTFAVGGGYRKDALSFDLGVNYMMRSETYYMYDPSIISETLIDQSRVGVQAAIGIRF